MPELPEVETTLRGIRPYLNNAIIEGIVVRNEHLRWPVPTTMLQSLVGQAVQSVDRRAKYLLVQTNAGTILLHLGMSGSLRVLDRSISPGKHDHIDFELSDSKILRYNDPRRFGCCLFVQPGRKNIENHRLLTALGPEPLSAEFTGEYLFRRSRNCSLVIKSFIMDGKVVVGVGNIYANESLFFAGIRPTTRVNRISRARFVTLADKIKLVLANAIEAGGTTLNDFMQADGKPGYFKQELHVYGRAGETCLVCNTEIKAKNISQRSTFYCLQCQAF